MYSFRYYHRKWIKSIVEFIHSKSVGEDMEEKLKQDVSMGANLRRLRKRAGLSQEKAAAQLQLMGLFASREIVSQMELGRYSVRVSVLLGMKEIYGASFDEFFEGLSLNG